MATKPRKPAPKGSAGKVNLVGIEANTPDTNQERMSLARMTRAARRGTAKASKANRISPRVLEALFRQEPLIQRAIFKLTGDLLKHGFTITEPGTTRPHARNDDVQAWFRDTDFIGRAWEALVASHVNGDGPVEFEWSDNATDPRLPPPLAAIPVAVHPIDPLNVDFEPFRDPKTGEVRYFLIQRSGDGDPVILHPDRFHNFRFKRLPGFIHGLSSVEAAYHAAIAKVKGDQGIGEVLYFSGISKVLATIKDGTPEEVDLITEMVNDPDFQRGWVWNDRLNVEPLNPTAIDPTGFYAVLKVSIAAAVGLPAMLVEGAQAGAVTGSETNLQDYYADLHQNKVTVIEPCVTRIVTGLTGLQPGQFDVQWKAPPMSPTAMRELASALQALRAVGLKPMAAAKLLNLTDLTEDDFEDPAPKGMLPTVDGNTPPGEQPGKADQDQTGQTDEQANPDTGTAPSKA